MSAMLKLANPTRFMEYSGPLLRWLSVGAAVLFAVGLYMVFVTSPEDYQQGQTVKIMYIHVPAAWLAMMGYSMIAISSIGSLVWRHPLADVSAKAAAPIGAAFTALALITGSLWGKPMWGTYWQWDARMTSVLVLLFLYLGLIAIWNAIEEQSRAGRAAAILGLVGFVNVPIIKFSVDWWNTLHQGSSVMRLDGPTIHPDLLWPLLVMAVAFTLLFLALHLAAMRNEILRRRVESLRMNEVASAASGAAEVAE
ncbi:MAG: heme ABC transporter permease CcmC [Hyphomicrobiaceae bacterium]